MLLEKYLQVKFEKTCEAIEQGLRTGEISIEEEAPEIHPDDVTAIEKWIVNAAGSLHEEEIDKADMEYLTAPNWTLFPPQNSAVEEKAHSDCISALDAEWNAIKNDYPEIENVNVRSCIARLCEATKFVEIAGFCFGETDSTVRQALFFRMADFYNVEYNTIYERWLYSN